MTGNWLNMLPHLHGRNEDVKQHDTEPEEDYDDHDEMQLQKLNQAQMAGCITVYLICWFYLGFLGKSSVLSFNVGPFVRQKSHTD